MKKGEMHPLRIARCQRNLTIIELAEAAKVGASTIWRAEHDYSINAESRRRLCAYFDTTPDELGLLGYSKHDLTFEQELPTHYAFEETCPPVYVTEKVPTVQLLPSEGSDGQQLCVQNAQSITTSTAETNSFAALLDADWELDTLLDALRIVFQGIHLLPSRLQHTLLLGMLSRTDLHNSTSIKQDIPEEERGQILAALHKSIAQCRQFCRTANQVQVLIAGQGLFYLLAQTQNYLSHENYHSLHKTITDLIGSALFFQEYNAGNQQRHKKIYQVTLEDLDPWQQAQDQEPVSATSRGKHAEALRFIEIALHLLDGSEEQDFQSSYADRNSLKSRSPVFGQQPSFVDY